MSGFVDLRLNRQEGQVNESFWPSFTDVMTVIMMIFLIAMVVLLMRNMELVKELRSTMEAERQAAEQAAQTGAANHSLSMQLSEAEARIAQLQRQLADQKTRDQAQIDDQQREIATLMSERNDLAEQLALARIALDDQRKAVADTQKQLAAMQQQMDNLEARLANTMHQRDTLDAQLTDTQQALAAAQRDQQAGQQQYSELVGKYDALRVKYDKLVRPARSPQGHYLVEIRYAKRDGQPTIAFREAGKGEYTTMTREALDKRLAAIKQAHDEGLYVKVIIPEDSALSYTEAWTFTRDMLGRYDYYYEGQQDELRADR